MILHNGSVRTGDARLPLARALALAGDRVGGGVDVREGDRSLVSNERVDLDGRCVVPGFTDAHVHFLEWSLSLGRLDLAETRSHADVLAAAAAARPNADGWVIGAGWRSERWPAGDPAPHREALDAASGERAVVLWAHDHHTVWLSSAALARLPIGSAPVVERDASGEPTGVLRETAAWDAAAAIPAPREHELDAAIAHGMREAHARGVTGIHDFQREHGLAAWQRLNADRRLTLRVWASLPAERLDEIIALGVRSGLGDEWLRIGPVKAFADGTLGSRTAAMLEPFADAGRGEALLSGEELRDLAGRCADAGLDLAVHAIGDARQPRRAGRARGDARALAAARAAAADRARAAAPPRRPRPLRRARRDRIHATLARALRPLPGRGRVGRALRGRLRARVAGRERSDALLRLRRPDRAARSAGGRRRPPRRATGRSRRRSRPSTRSTASGAAPRTPGMPSGASGGCCPATPPTSSCSSATP